MPSAKAAYEATGNVLVDRILALLPEHPEILTMPSPFGLFDVPGFRCDDLKPTLAQASAALHQARAIWHLRKATE